LTSPYAGSDAASLPDRGVLVEREFNGRRTRGFLVTFSKRYITLAPVATVVGLAFHAYDETRPEGEREPGITCALIPAAHEGVQIGKCHAVAGLIAKMAVELYATDAARRFTAAVLDRGESPSVASAILKVQLTEAGRRAVNDAMDILGGKGIMRRPSNLLAVA